MKSAQNSRLALLAAGAGGAAVAGFGFAFGRDIYKNGKKSAGYWLLLAVAMFAPFFGARNLVRGHDRGFLGTVFLTVLCSVMLIALGFLATSLIALYFALAVENENGQYGSVSNGLFIGGVVTAVLAGVGSLVGLYQRPKRLKTFAVGRENEHFLREMGFQETNSTDITHYAPDGQALRFLESHPDKLVFMAIGRRGKRASINLDENGRMISYVGVV